mmetsp:Transcript_49458/g.117685  ORF Transcript_49458/g.117685 Transcript_49458/m.117685 type:complete len:486 (-) Transcript_49458:156-1613(-)
MPMWKLLPLAAAAVGVTQGALRGDDAAGETCDFAIVGAGVGGGYAALRAAEAGQRVCVFEMNNRPGGRIHSLRNQGPNKDLVVEAGAYRFTASKICQFERFCFDTPIIRSLVKELHLTFAVYDPDPTQWDHKMRKLVDKEGNDAGYLTLPETLLQKAMERGAKVSYNSKVVGLFGNSKNESAKDSSAVFLKIAGGGVVKAKAVLLNIAQGPALELLRHSGMPFAAEDPDPLYDPTTEDLMKLYVHYDDAWWRNDLGLKAGHFQNGNPREDGYLMESPAPLSGQYHDGNLRCDLPGGKCRGYLQAYYSGEAIEFYKPYHNLVGEAAVELSPDTREHKRLLAKIHSALVDLHRDALDAVNATERVSKMRPSAGVLSIWRDSVDGINAGCHNPKLGSEPSPGDLTNAALKPFPDMPVFLANEAFGPISCWAEGSLNMSHRVMQHMGIPQPMLKEEPLDLSMPPPPTDPFLMYADRRWARMLGVNKVVV